MDSELYEFIIESVEDHLGVVPTNPLTRQLQPRTWNKHFNSNSLQALHETIMDDYGKRWKKILELPRAPLERISVDGIIFAEKPREKKKRFSVGKAKIFGEKREDDPEMEQAEEKEPGELNDEQKEGKPKEEQKEGEKSKEEQTEHTEVEKSREERKDEEVIDEAAKEGKAIKEEQKKQENEKLETWQGKKMMEKLKIFFKNSFGRKPKAKRSNRSQVGEFFIGTGQLGELVNLVKRLPDTFQRDLKPADFKSNEFVKGLQSMEMVLLLANRIYQSIEISCTLVIKEGNVQCCEDIMAELSNERSVYAKLFPVVYKFTMRGLLIILYSGEEMKNGEPSNRGVQDGPKTPQLIKINKAPSKIVSAL